VTYQFSDKRLLPILERRGEPLTFEEVRDRTKEALGVTEKVPSVWNNVCVNHLRLQEKKHPEADEQTLLRLTEIAIYTYYLEGPGASTIVRE